MAVLLLRLIELSVVSHQNALKSTYWGLRLSSFDKPLAEFEPQNPFKKAEHGDACLLSSAGEVKIESLGLSEPA